MTITRRLTAQSIFVVVSLILLSWMLILPFRADAQQGNNAVWGGSSTPVGSAAYIDASAFANPLTDICATLYSIISSTGYPANGAVIDARGINAVSSAADSTGDMTCANSPWSNGSTTTSNPATILLPAGYMLGGTYTGNGNIIVYQTWTLPNGSKIIGEGPNTSGRATLQAASGFTGSSIIAMGSSTLCPAYGCTGVAVEDITIEGSNLYIDGIDNAYSQQGSYVKDVKFTDIGGTGLNVSAPNSGPYSDLYYTAPVESCSGGTCPTCATLQAQTLGVHGMTCIGTGSVAGSNNRAAIYINASNNRVEDLHVETFSDGIRIGDIASGTVGNVVVSNVMNSIDKHGPIISTVHICGHNPNGNFLTCPNNNHTTGSATVSDITILQATDLNGNNFDGGSASSAVVEDDVMGTSITPQNSDGGATAALYVLGEQTGGNGQYSRFSTNPSPNANNHSTVVPTWIVGSGSVTAGQTCGLPGALYSNTAGGSTTAIYVCKWIPTSPYLQWADLI